MTEEHSYCYLAAKEMRGLTLEEFWKDWNNLNNSLNPNYQSIHRNCDCNNGTLQQTN